MSALRIISKVTRQAEETSCVVACYMMPRESASRVAVNVLVVPRARPLSLLTPVLSCQK